MLYGCTEAELNGSGELSEEYVESAFDKLNDETAAKLPENVENGTVSEEIYNESMRFVSEFTEYQNDMFGYLDKINEDSSLKEDEFFLDDFRESIDSYEVFLKGFHLSPKTEADIELNNNLSDTIFYMSYVVSGLRQYVNTKDALHVNSLEENVNEASTSYDALGNSLMKYELYTE